MPPPTEKFFGDSEGVCAKLKLGIFAEQMYKYGILSASTKGTKVTRS